MDFGQLLEPSALDQIRWSLPSCDSREEEIQLTRLAKAAARSKQAPLVAVGAPIWSHAQWVGNLYPPGTTSSEFLKEYSKQFSTVEVNSTFYGIPPAEMIQKWKAAVGASFRFCPKFPKSISHSMNGDHPDLRVFADRVAILGENLGVCFLQFPSYVGPDQKARIEALLAKIPRGLKTVVELRHPQFFHDQRLKSEWLELLARNFIGTVSVDTPLERAVAHTSLTSTRIMIRFLGANLHSSNDIRFQQWSERIALWIKHGVKEVYFVAHEPDNTHAAEAARSFIDKFNLLRATHEGLPELTAPSFHSLF
jgi:uncharacterized protein YecE (DUF72 family)